MIQLLLKLSILTCLSTAACALTEERLNQNTIEVAKNVDLNRYLGRWYAITTLPQRFTKDCLSQTADYNLGENNTINLVNTCYKDNDKQTSLTGTAVAVDTPNNAVLEIEFNNIFIKIFGGKGDYVIFKLDPDYKFALVGSRNLKSLWLLSRTKTVSEKVYNEYVSRAEEIGFDVTKLQDSVFN